MLNKDKKKVLNAILKDKSIDWLRDEVIRLCTALPDGLELVTQDAARTFGRTSLLADTLLTESWERAADAIRAADDYYRGNDDDVYDDGYYYLDLAKKQIKGASQKTRQQLICLSIELDAQNSAGFTDELWNFCCALCKDEQDWRSLIRELESHPDEYNRRRILEILRKIKDDDSFEALQLKNLNGAHDYLRLVQFYRSKRKEKLALEYARRGMQSGEGRVDDLAHYLLVSYAKTHATADLEWVMKICEERESYCFQAADALFSYFDLDHDYAKAKKYLLKKADHARGHEVVGLYEQVKGFLTSEDFKEEERSLLTSVRVKDFDAYLEVLIQRKDYREALDAIKLQAHKSIHWYSRKDYSEAADKLARYYPEEVIEYYFSFAIWLIEKGAGRHRKNYESAVEYLQRAKRIYLKVLKDPLRWVNKLEEIRAHYQGKRAFIEVSRMLGN